MSKIKEILEERGSNYGSFKTNALLAQSLKALLRSAPNWVHISDEQREALDMIIHKVARILNGNPEYEDNWLDIIGYVQLTLDELNKTKS